MISSRGFVFNLDFSAWALPSFTYYLNFTSILPIQVTNVSGYFTTIAAVILFSGVQLISIGILGEYIGKIYYEVKRRPHFVVGETNIEKAGER